jgi:hypothetical protein
MTKTYLKILLLALPLLAMAFLEALIFPRDQFTFRAWEAIKVNFFSESLPGPFYPNTRHTFWEAGDSDKKKIKNRKNLWVTDGYGHRNERLPRQGEVYGVLVGDSNIVGSSLDQKDLLSERLTKRTGDLWINLSHEYITPWEHPICKVNRPKWIVYELKRGSLLNLPNLGGRGSDPVSQKNQNVLVRIDHTTKLSILNKARSWFGCGAISIREQVQSPHLAITFSQLQNALTQGFIPRELGGYKNVSEMTPLQILRQHQAKCDSMGIVFILVVLPDTEKEADPLIRQIELAGVRTIGFLPSNSFPRGADLESFWQKEDSHWSKKGIEITAEKIVEQIEMTKVGK